MSDNITHNLVNWFEIYVQDMPRACAFYESVLEIKLQKFPNAAHEMWVFPMSNGLPGASGSLIKMDDCPSGEGGTLIYFSTPDCGKALANAVKNGGTIVDDKFAVGDYGFISLAKDTEGNMIGFHSYK